MSIAMLKVHAALEARGCSPKRTPNGWFARCPAHDDRHASLTVGQGPDGRALLKCHAGCSLEAVVDALGLRVSDLFPLAGQRSGNRATSAAPPPPAAKVHAEADEVAAELVRRHGEPAGRWEYHNANGELVGLVLRWDRPDGKLIRPVARIGGGWAERAMPTPRPLYKLPELLGTPSDARVYVVEGEKSADAAARLGLFATTSAGGAAAAKQTDWAPLRGRRVVVVPDNDEPGERYAADVARLALAAGAREVRVVRLSDRWPDLPLGGDVADLQGDPAELRREIEALVAAAEPERSPTSDRPTWRRFPAEALPEPMREFVAAAARATGTDPSYAGLAALVTAAGCVGNRAAVIIKRGWTEPAVLWGALLGRSGTLKSPVLRLVTRPVYDRLRRERAEYAAALADHEREHSQWEAAKKKSKDGAPPAPEPPREKRTVVSDITIEKLGALLADNPKGLLLVRDELAAWIGGFDRYAKGRGSELSAWLSFYDAAPAVIDRKSGGNIFVERGAVSVIGGLQPGLLERVFTSDAREAGMLARVLLVHPPERPATWVDDELPDAAAARWRDLVDGLLDLEPAADNGDTVTPRYLPLTDEARAAFIAWHDALARRLADEPDELLAAALSKLKGACVRLALILECAGAVAAGREPRCIGVRSVKAAAALADWFANEARRVYGLFGESDADRDQRRLVAWLERRGGTATVRDLTRGPREYRDPDRAEGALRELVAVGLAEWVHDVGDLGGRPAARVRLKASMDGDDEAHVGGVSGDETPPKSGVGGDETPKTFGKFEVSSPSPVSPAENEEAAGDGGWVEL